MLAIGAKLTAEQRLSKALVDIMANPKYVALAGVLMIGDRSVTDVPTACTNGRDEQYGRAYIEELNDAQLRFLVLHESYHKLYRHLTTWRHLYEEDAKLANMACDYVINLKIADDNADKWADMPEGGLLNPKYRDWDSARVFLDLKRDQNQGQSQGQESLDQHEWDAAKELTQAQKRELAQEVDEAIRQGALIAGKLGSGGARGLEELLQPQINWREALREFVQTTCTGKDFSTWARPSRRFLALGHYMPSGISEQVGELVIAVDTSGSIGQTELTAFLSEIKSLCETVRPEAVRLLYWDTEIARDEKYTLHELDNLAQTTKPLGGGGTCVRCVPNFLTTEGVNPQAVVVLTDGYLGDEWGKWPCPVLWCILDNKWAKPDVGKVINIKVRDL